MDITKIQKLIRKAIKDYAITAKYDEEILVSFLSVDLFREMNGLVEESKRGKQNP